MMAPGPTNAGPVFTLTTVTTLTTILSIVYVHGVSAAIDVSEGKGFQRAHTGDSSGHYEPMVAMLCPDKGQQKFKYFQNKFLSKSGKWQTDYGVKSTCKKDKIDILQYCKQVYPELNIVNIVESTKFEKIDEWCKLGSLKCKGPQKWVKPYRCIEMTPESSSPASSGRSTSAQPGQNKDKATTPEDDFYYADDYLDEEDDEYYYDDDDDDDDEYYDDDDDDEDYYDDEDDLLNEIDVDGEQKNKKDTEEDKKSRKALDRLEIDPYYTHYIPGQEHKQFSKALERVEEKHRAKMTKVMREWTQIEEKYESLAKTDSKHADKLKQEESDQFEKRIKNLEDENQAEKDQLIAMHQQRVVSRINQVKEDAMKCYTNSLNQHPVNYPTVRECLEKLLRSLHKDRHHTLSHYKNMVETVPAQAEQQKEATLKHLTDIDRIVNESLSLLDRFPELRVKLLPLMEDFLIELRSSDDTPAPMFTMDRDHEEKILNGFKINIQNRIMKQEEKRKEEKRLRKEKIRRMKEEEEEMVRRRKELHYPVGVGVNPLEAVEYTEERVLVSNSQAHSLSHPQADYVVDAMESSDSKLGFISVLGVAALLVVLLVGIVFHRRRNTHIRSHQGFLEVPTFSSPEEKHLSTMQANGYENPTYKYFEATSA